MNLQLIHQAIEALDGCVGLMTGEMRIARGGEDGLMTEELLQVGEVDASFDAMRGVAVP